VGFAGGGKGGQPGGGEANGRGRERHCVHLFVDTLPRATRATVQPNATFNPGGKACIGASVTVLTLASGALNSLIFKEFLSQAVALCCDR
jgi:hypothetical protein